MNFKIKKNKGFTLIELLIAIAIIGVLTTLLMTNFVGIRQRARDAQRKSDIRQIQSSLELYRSDNSIYPTISGVTYRVNGSTACPTSQSLQSGATVYMSKIPCDSLGTSTYNSGNYYYYTPDGVTYVLASCLENANDNDPNSTTNAPSPSGGTCSSGKYFVVTNP
ncbi:MAG: ral secretion pathway protein [Patescibacteria group bacterium]|jgi:type II secretion system protein G|nr:ral secretion pathway protein [Patescibacteria group bacterium]